MEHPQCGSVKRRLQLAIFLGSKPITNFMKLWSIMKPNETYAIINILHWFRISWGNNEIKVTFVFLCSFILLNNDVMHVVISALLKKVNGFRQRYNSVPLWCNRSGAGVTKAPFANFSVSEIFDLAKVPVRFPESHSYLTGVTAAELRQHLPNINVIFNS